MAFRHINFRKINRIVQNISVPAIQAAETKLT